MRLCISSQLSTIQKILLKFRDLVTFRFPFLWHQKYVYEIFKILSCIEAVLV